MFFVNVNVILLIVTCYYVVRDGYVTCNATSTCIPGVWVCDDYPDCEDAEDEMDCPCLEHQYTCDNETAGSQLAG